MRTSRSTSRSSGHLFTNGSQADSRCDSLLRRAAAAEPCKHLVRLQDQADTYSRMVPKPIHDAIRYFAARLPVSHANISFDFKIKRTLIHEWFPSRFTMRFAPSPRGCGGAMQTSRSPSRPSGHLFTNGSQADSRCDSLLRRAAAGEPCEHLVRLQDQADTYSRMVPKPIHDAIRSFAARLRRSHANISFAFKTKRTLIHEWFPSRFTMRFATSPRGCR